MRARNLWAGLVLALATATGMAQTPLPDQLGHVNDLAGAMSGDAASQLGEILSGYAVASGIRIAVLTIENPVEESPETAAGRALAIFLKGDSTQRGAMLMWTANGHIVIYVGEGLRSAIPDAEVQAIIDESVVPAAAAGDVDNALLLGAYRLVAAASGAGLGGAVDDGRVEPPPSLPLRAPPIAIPQHAAAALERDLNLLTGAFAEDPVAAAAWFWARVQTQARALQATTAEQMPLILSDADSMVFLAIALAVLVIALTAIWQMSRSLPVAGCALVLAAAVVIWLMTGFTELSLLVLLAGPIGLMAWLILGRGIAARLAGTAAQPAAPENTYAVWLAQQQAKQAALRPSAPRAQPTSSAAAAVKAVSVSAQAGAAKPPAPALRRMSGMLERAHAAGTATPAMDRVAARLHTITSAEYKPQRTVMLVMLVVFALFFLPLAFLAVVIWIAREVNALKLPNQKLGEFFQQLSRESQALQRFQSQR